MPMLCCDDAWMAELIASAEEIVGRLDARGHALVRIAAIRTIEGYQQGLVEIEEVA